MCFEIWWTGTFSPNVALIHLTVSGENGFYGLMDDGRPREDSCSDV